MCSALDLDEIDSALGRSLAVLTMSGSRQEVNQPFSSVCLTQDDAGPHQALVGSHACGVFAITESTGVIGGL